MGWSCGELIGAGWEKEKDLLAEEVKFTTRAQVNVEEVDKCVGDKVVLTHHLLPVAHDMVYNIKKRMGVTVAFTILFGLIVGLVIAANRAAAATQPAVHDLLKPLRAFSCRRQ